MVMDAETAAVLERVTTLLDVVEPTEPKAEVEEKEAEPTLAEMQAALATEKAAREQTEQRLKSAQGQLKGKLDTEAFQQATRRGLANLEARFTALAKGQVEADPEVARKGLADVEEAIAKETTQQGFNARFATIQRHVLQDMEDAGLDATAPELADANKLWEQGNRTGDLRLLEEAAEITREVRRNVQIAAWEKEQADARKKSGSLSTPTIRASGSGRSAVADRQLEKDVASGAVAMTPAIQKRLDAIWNS